MAFLRGINVGGHAIIKMDELKNVFSSLSFENVTTYIQSGNVIFDFNGKVSLDDLKVKIERKLNEVFGIMVVVVLLRFEDLKAIVRASPFQTLNENDDDRFYVTFLAEKLLKKLKAPLFSSKKDVEIVFVKDGVVFSKSHKINGKSGFPNLFIEKECGVSATTRNWKVVEKIVKI